MRFRFVIALLAIGMAPATGACEAARWSDYTCTISGWCPGTLTLEWSGATPHSRQGILFSLQRGEYVISRGPCAGTALGLDQAVFLVRIIGTDAGSGTIRGWSSGSCGGYVQLIEAGSCNTSTVARLP